MSLISKELNSKGDHFSTSSVFPAAEPKASDPASSSAGLAYKSRIRQEPTNVTAPQWGHALWSRLTSLVEDMAGACVKVSSSTLLDVDLNCHDAQVYTLEKVLKLKKDPISQIVFLDEAMKVNPTLPPHPITLVMFRRSSKINQAQRFGLHWPGLWRSRHGTGQRVRWFPKPLVTLKHLLRLGLSATNIKLWLSKAFTPLPRLLLKNRGAYRYCIHPGTTKVRIYLMTCSAIYP